MKKTLAIFILSFSFFAIYAQKTKTYTNPDKLYYDGKEKFELKQYNAAFRYLDEYLQSQHKDLSPYYADAEYYMVSSAYEMRRKDAGKRLEKFVQNNPHSSHLNRVRFLQGSLNYERSRYKNAVDDYFSECDPSILSKEEQSDFYFRTGYCYLQLQEYDKAKEAFQWLISVKSKYELSAFYYNAYIDYRQKKYDAALSTFINLQSYPEYDSIVSYYIVQIYHAKKMNEQVLLFGQKVIDKYPENQNNAEIYRIMGECYFQKKDYKNTIKYFTLYEKGSEQVVRNDMYMLGIAYFYSEDCDNAISRLKKVTSVDDVMAQNAYLHLGSCYLKKDDKVSARLAFESASRLDFDKNVQEEALYNYALIVYEQSYSPFNESVIAFEKFLSTFPESRYADSVYDYLLNVYLTTKNYQAAYESIQKIKSKNPKILEARQRVLYCMGIQQFTETEYDKAISYFSQSLEDGKSNFDVEASTLFWRGEAYYRKKDYKKAEADFIKFLGSVGSRNCKEFNLAHYDLGYCFFTEKDYVNALSWFRKYVNIEDQNKTILADANNRIGDCYFYVRDFENAEKSYASVYALKGAGADYACFQQAFVQGLRKNYAGKIETLEKLIKTFPQSEYIADAMYEIGRSYVMQGNSKAAIETYDKLSKNYFHSPLSRKGRLQSAMLYDEMKNTDQSIKIYKEIVDLFPNSVEAKTALESLKRIYFENNDIQAFADYVESLGGVTKFEITEQDSLTYFAAERLFLHENYHEAISSFDNYLEKFKDGCFIGSAHFNLANSYAKLGNKTKAKAEYQIVVEKIGGVNLENALIKLAEMQFDDGEYEPMIASMNRLLEITQQVEVREAAKLGLLRCNNMLGNYEATVLAAEELIKGDKLDPAVMREAMFTRAKAYEKNNELAKALEDYKALSENCLDVYGAESKYRVAEYLFHENKSAEAEKEVFNFIEKNTPHQYWLAKAFILLSDIYMRQGNDFEAKQYLLSVRENYKGEDDINMEIKSRLDEIENREFNHIVNE